MGSGSPALSGSGRRCARHALGAGPDGLCVLCHRSRGSRGSRGSRSHATWMLGGVLGAILVVSATAVAHRMVTSFAGNPVTAPAPLLPNGPLSELDAHAVAPSEPAVAGSEPAVAGSEPAVAGSEPAVAGSEPAVAPSGPALAATAPLAAELPPASEESAPATRPPPSPAELQAALSATPIVMYSASWCGVCRKAKQFFSANGLRYREIDADTTPGAWEKVEQLSGRRAVPLIIVDGEQTPPGLSPPSIMRAASRSVERRLGVRGIQIRAN